MHSFESDYTAGARVEILRRLNETNLEQLPGYGSDKYCESAKEKIRAACDCPGADIFFMVGGTQTNATVIAAALLTALPEALRSFADYRMLIYAIVLIVVMIFNQSPQMIAMRKRLTARFRKDAADRAPKKNKKEAA